MRLAIATVLMSGCIFGSGSLDVEGDALGDCFDEVDNDDNGFVDCEDAGCVQTDECIAQRELDDPDTGDADTERRTVEVLDALNDNAYPPDPDCDGFEGQPYPGATGWFAGVYDLRGSEVAGYEAWALLPNASWEQAAGAEDCQMTWTVSGEDIGADGCSNCTFQLDYSGTFRPADSTCLEDLQDANSDPFTAVLDVYVSGTSVELRFSASNSAFGQGTLTDGILTWRSDRRCFYF